MWVIPPTDLACIPRRDGGPAAFRIAVRALERYAILASNGGAHIGGLAADGAVLYRSMSVLV